METRDILIGIGIGLLVAWIYNKRNNSSLSPSEYEKVFSNMINRMDRLEELLIRQQEYQQPTPVIAPIVDTGYKNDEKWLIERGKDGHIKSLQIVRDAKVKRLD